MPALLSWLLSAFGTAVGYSVVRWAAWKIFIWSIMTTVVPIVISAVVYKLIENVMATVNTVNSQYGSGVQSFIVNFTGLAAWLIIHLKLIEGFALIMSAVLFRVAIRMIPFVKL